MTMGLKSNIVEVVSHMNPLDRIVNDLLRLSQQAAGGQEVL